MKVRIEFVDSLQEEEVVIHCMALDARVARIQQYAMEQIAESVKIVFYKESQEYYFPVGEVLFFETSGEYVFGHTTEEAYRIKYRLYELEKILPSYFMRISKSTILNTRRIYSIERNITSASLVQFQHSHKEVFVSRNYYKSLRQKLMGRGQYEK